MNWPWSQRGGGRFGGARAAAAKGPGRAALGLFALVALVILWGPTLRPPPAVGNLAEDRGYPAFVRELAGQGLLREDERGAAAAPGATPGLVRFDEERVAQMVAAHAAGNGGGIGRCRQKPSLGNLWARWVDATPGKDDCLALMRNFRRLTFLREDMRIDASQVWEREEERLVGLAPGAHVVSDARATFTAWRGAVNYARPYVHTMLVDLATREPLLRFDPTAQGEQVFSVGRSLANDSGGLIASSIRLRDSRRQCQADVRLSLLGDHVLLTLFPRNRISDCAPVYVDNRPLYSDDTAFGGFDYQVLAPGQVVTFGARERPLVLQVVQSLGALSAMDDRVRRFDPSLAPVGQAIALARPLDDDFTTTIEPRLHYAAQRLLERQAMAEIPGERSSFRAAAMLVDGLTGDVVAMPTFPLVSAHLAAGERSSSTRLGWLSQNQNLVPLPVGSAAKVPFATAIVQAHPQLLSLKVFGRSSSFTHLLGDPLTQAGLPLKDTVSGDVDFNRFIASSSNYYALMLMRLAAPLDPLASDGRALAPADRYSIGGRIRTRAPALPGPGQGWSASWAPLLWKIACVPPYRNGAGPFSGWWDGQSSPCPRHYLEGAAVADPGMLNAIAHHSPQLELENVDPADSFADYYMSILGQNRSTWTNAALIQAYGRIMTDRQLRLHFDRAAPQAGAAAQGQPRIDLSPQVWQAVTRGLQAVVNSGSGQRLGEGLGDQFEGITIMAKTGTASLGYRTPGFGESAEEGHVMVVGFLRFSGEERTADEICSARLVSVNFENNDGGQPALQMVLSLMRDPAIARWATAPCPGGSAV